MQQRLLTALMLGTGGNIMSHQYGPSSDAEEMCCFATVRLGVWQIPATHCDSQQSTAPAVDVTHNSHAQLVIQLCQPFKPAQRCSDRVTCKIVMPCNAVISHVLQPAPKRRIAEAACDPVIYRVPKEENP